MIFLNVQFSLPVLRLIRDLAQCCPLLGDLGFHRQLAQSVTGSRGQLQPQWKDVKHWRCTEMVDGLILLSSVEKCKRWLISSQVRSSSICIALPSCIPVSRAWSCSANPRKHKAQAFENPRWGASASQGTDTRTQSHTLEPRNQTHYCDGDPATH